MQIRKSLATISVLAAILGIPFVAAGQGALGGLMLLGGILGYAGARIMKEVS